MKKTITHGNGNQTTYQITDSGTAYHEDTPKEVVSILERIRENRTRVKFNFGDIKTGRDWNEENDTTGTVGRSSGNIKIPLLIKTSRSYGGGALLDHCILKITETKTGRTLYKAANYMQSNFRIEPSDMQGYSHNLIIDGELYSRHKTERGAKILFNKLSK